jgi:hypothetical protein
MESLTAATTVTQEWHLSVDGSVAIGGPARATSRAMADALKACVSGIVEASRFAVCVEPAANKMQQVECDRSCAEQASSEIRRIVGPPH